MVNFNNFQQLDPATRDIAIDLLAKDDEHPPSFMSFVFRWMAFNAWASAVTLEGRDADMVKALAAEPRLNDAYDTLMAGDAAFVELVGNFTKLWPVLNVGGIRKAFGFDAFWQNDRNTLLAMCTVNNVRVQPDNWPAFDRPSWSQMLWTIYQVRCNLFHGQKSPENGRDRDLVAASDRILSYLLAATNCFDWCDMP